MNTLKAKSLVQLRGIAQSYGIDDIFSLDAKRLIQEIELKQEEASPASAVVIDPPQYDARLMTKPPSKQSDERSIEELLTPYVAMGMKLTFDHERWYMAWADKTDEGTKRMPLRTVLNCAIKLMV